jgi:threonine synthase
MFVQVGGGALATAVARGFLWAHHAGRIARAPRLHPVQTRGCAPLVRAYDRVAARVLAAAGHGEAPLLDTLDETSVRVRIERAARIARLASSSPIDAAVHVAATQRSTFMQSWDTEPHSVATGILDDETYYWLAIVEAMLRTGGYPVLAAEDTLRTANRLVHDATGLEVCMTGTAGLAGVMDALPHDARLAHERIGVVFSGARR